MEINRQHIERLKTWRKKITTDISEFSALQKDCEKSNDFETAKFYGNVKKDNIRFLDKINYWINQEEN